MSNPTLLHRESLPEHGEDVQREQPPFTGPEQPDQVLGVDTAAILRLGRAATALGVLPNKVNLGLYALPDAVRLVPLVEKMQSDSGLESGDVLSYRKPIIKLKGIGSLDKLAAAAEATRITKFGAPRRALDRKIEQEFPRRATEAIDKARELVASVENDVDHLASFENPKQQFVAEINDLAKEVSTAIIEQRDRRVQSIGQFEVEPETPRGIIGFFTKAVRKVRGFFGRFKRRQKVNTEVTAYDAGVGIEQTISSLTEKEGPLRGRLPMLSQLFLDRLPKNMPITPYRLAIVAPEILNFLFSTSYEDENSRQIVDGVNRNPHEFRHWSHRIIRHFGYSLEGIQRASVTLLPAIRDVLPSEGSKVREIFSQAQELLQQKQPISEAEESPGQANASKKGKRHRLRNLLRRSKKLPIK